MKRKYEMKLKLRAMRATRGWLNYLNAEMMVMGL